MEIGQRVGSRYVIEAVAGTGGMSTVYRATDEDGSPVAIKVLPHALEKFSDRFSREARILMKLEHPAIVKCLGNGITSAGERFLVMEWLEGVDLSDYLADHRLSLGESLALVARMARALGSAHKHLVVHRDVKPSNIFLPGGELGRAKLLDFGVAHWAAATQLTGSGMRLGTPSYMSPEQIRGERVDSRADVFALGCVLYLCLSGKPAYAGDYLTAVFYKILMAEYAAISAIVSGVPEPVQELLAAMMTLEPVARPRDGNELAERIERIERELRLSSRADQYRLRPIETAPATLTEDELRLVSVVAVAASKTPIMMPGRQMSPERRAKAERAHRQQVENPDPDKTLVMNQAVIDRLRQRYASLGARFDHLANGGMIVVIDTRSASTDHVDVAARVALELREVIADRAIAVATGRAVLGQVRVLGEVIDRAVALMSEGRRSPTAAIRLCDMTAGLLGPRFAIERDDRGTVLTGEQADFGYSRLLGNHTPFVGRLREMALLEATLAECVEEETARAAVVTAPAGMGKSRLVREFLQRIAKRDDDVGIWQCSGDPMRAGSPFDLLAQAIRGLAAIREGEPLVDSQKKLVARVARATAGKDARRIALFLGELINTPWPDEEDVQLAAARHDSRLMGEQIRRACREFLAAEATLYPVLIVLEDLQWGDQATVAWIDSILRDLAERPIFVLAVGRPEAHELFGALWVERECIDMRLRRLSPHSAKKLIKAALGSDVPADRMTQLVARADGNPFYLEELIRSAAADRWELPDTVLAMVHARLQEIPASARRVLRGASIMGDRLWGGSLVALCGEGVDTSVEIDWLVESEFLVESETCKFAGQDEYRFRHALIREAAYGMLTPDDRKLGHRLAAEWLEKVGEADALVVAEHFERGGALGRARPFFLRAALGACKSGNLDTALTIAERGAAIGDRDGTLGKLRAVQAKAYQWRGQHDDAIELGEEALSLLPSGDRVWYEVAEDIAASHGVRNNIDALEEWAVTMSRGRSKDHDRSGWLIVASRLSWILFVHGSTAVAQSLLEQIDIEMPRSKDAAGENAENSGEDIGPAVAARVHAARACRGWFVDGNPADLVRELRRVVASYEESGDLHNACDQGCNTGFAEMELGLYEAAEATLAAALSTARALKLDALVDACRQNSSLALAYQGKLDEARALALASAESHEKSGDQRMAAASRRNLATILLLAGDLVEAEKQARLSIELCANHPPVKMTALATLARVLLARQQPQQALEQAEQAIELLQGLEGQSAKEAAIRLVWAEALYQNEQREKAREAISRARDLLLASSDRIDQPAWRQSFLQAVPDHARILELYQSWKESE